MANAVVEPVKSKRAAPFPWTGNENLTYQALQVLAYKKPYQYKPGCPESVNGWKEIVDDLRQADAMFVTHDLDVKKVRDHLNGILRKRETLVKILDKQSGIGDVQTSPMQDLMDQIIAERNEYVEFFKTQQQEKKQTEEKEEEKAKDIRLNALQSLGKKRKPDDKSDDKSPGRKERRTANDTLTFLCQRAEERRAERKEEIELRQKDLDARTKQAESTNNAMLEMMRVMHEQSRNSLEMQRQREATEAREREERREDERKRNEQQNNMMQALIEALNRK